MEPVLLSAASTVNVTNLGPEVTARKQTCKRCLMLESALLGEGTYYTYSTSALIVEGTL